VIAIDTNILVYAHRRDSEFHEPAARSLQEVAESGGSWAIPWPCIAEFYSVATHSRLYDPPSTVDQATDQINYWMESPTLVTMGEPANAWRSLCNVLLDSKVTGAMVYDARIAALCIAHGIRELWTADRDYGRFPGIRTRNPLVGAA
jgi:toxin-antitoxin system PIN domain toxin